MMTAFAGRPLSGKIVIKSYQKAPNRAPSCVQTAEQHVPWPKERLLVLSSGEVWVRLAVGARNRFGRDNLEGQGTQQVVISRGPK